MQILCEGSELISPIHVEVQRGTEEDLLDVTSESSQTMSVPDYYEAPSIGHVSFSGLSEPCLVGSVVEVVVSALTDRKCMLISDKHTLFCTKIPFFNNTFLFLYDCSNH